MLLPSGPANTRCSVCRFDPGGLHVQFRPGARNGFAEPRDRQPKSTLSRPQPAAETARPAFEPAEMPANCGLFVRDRETSVRIGLRGGAERTQTTCQACSPIERVFGAAKNGHRKSALAARSPGAWPRRAVKPPRRIAARRKRDGGYAPCPNPAVTLCRKDWISCVNRAVVCPLRTPACPGIPPRRLPTGIGDWNGTDGFSGIQTLAWRTIDLSARTKPTI